MIQALKKLFLFTIVLIIPLFGISQSQFSEEGELPLQELKHWGVDSLDKMLEDGVGLMLDGNYIHAFQYLKTCSELSEKSEDYTNYFLSINNIGNIYYFLNETDSALFYYFQALRIAEDKNLLAQKNTVLNNIGVIYGVAGKDEEAKNILEQALNTSQELGDKHSIALNSINLSEHYMALGNYEKANSLLHSAMDYFSKNEDSYGLSIAYYQLAELSFDKEDYVEAESNYRKGIDLLDVKIHPIDKPQFYFGIAKCKIQNGSIDSALVYYNKSLKSAVDIKLYKMATQVLDSISSLYTRMGSYEEALITSRESRIFRDSIIAHEKSDEIERSRMLFELTTKENEFRLVKEKNEERQKYIFALFALLVLAIVLLLFVLRLRIKQGKLKQAKYELEQIKAKEKLKKSRAKNEELRGKIENINYELVSRSILLESKNQIISSISDIVHDLEINAGGNDTGPISTLKSQLLMEKNAEKNWQDFQIFFERIHANFFKEIHEEHPDLTTNDLRFLAYLLLRLNTKEIAVNLGITPESVRKRKQRIREKLGLKKHEDLMDHLRVYSL